MVCTVIVPVPVSGASNSTALAARIVNDEEIPSSRLRPSQHLVAPDATMALKRRSTARCAPAR